MLKPLLASLLLLVIAACQKSPTVGPSPEIRNSSAVGLIGGSEEVGMPAVVSLNYLQDPVCTGSLVGLNPPTVITARHCADEVMSEIFSVHPEKIITMPFGISDFDPKKQNAPGDLAVLIYPNYLADALEVKSKDLFTVAPVALTAHQEISLCGFGNTNHSSRYAKGVGKKKCGSNLVILEDSGYDFWKQMNSFILYFRGTRKSFESFTREEKVKYVHSRLQRSLMIYGPGVYLGIGRFTKEAFEIDPQRGYDEEGSVVLSNKGDSGGPWFVSRRGENPHLLAITSVGLNLLNEREELVGSLAWRLDHPWSKALLKKAAAEGADILGLQELLNEPVK